jgi:hypothetical protein
MERIGRAMQSHRVLTALAFVAIAGVSLQMLSGAMDRYWGEVEESYVVATRKAEEYRALGGKASVIRQGGGLYQVMYGPFLSQPIDLCEGTMTLDPPIPPDP